MSSPQRSPAPGEVVTLGAKAIAAAAAFSPPTIGLALIVVVIGDIGPSMITRSVAVAVAALVVGALLILGSAALYTWDPGSFVAFSRTFTGHPPADEEGDELEANRPKRGRFGHDR